MSHSQISPAAISRIAEYFKVLSEVSRLQILCCLRSGAKNVTEIIGETGLGQANVSKHLKILTQVGMVSRQPQGVSVFYEIADSSIFRLCEIACNQLSVRLEEESQHLEQLDTFKRSRLM
ncbi:winged helix-turn-helix transcriptional regulator [Lusitaniella coriacea LEGE 07157]|uniref:Winged helix-turn-helix transcriptional regulator n=1 Tax=Lusitaniella coriacea LEGE 07157 TaxID=945747 RepID=A0A8J7IX96_9CYAN|nr:metalloregulator ArsR/SmtB family transcription factor [Lusitaniella coriacea]MBE9118592.1 winged helix-turn-helix transcriptional regulator [Lusitaniella coriacea LEGE 07157]